MTEAKEVRRWGMPLEGTRTAEITTSEGEVKTIAMKNHNEQTVWTLRDPDDPEKTLVFHDKNKWIKASKKLYKWDPARDLPHESLTVESFQDGGYDLPSEECFDEPLDIASRGFTKGYDY